MKINGLIIEGPRPEVIVIPKNGVEYVFKAAPVLSFKPFEDMCPVPNPPEIIKKGGAKSYDFEDKTYNDAIIEWAGRKNSWMILESLKATEGLEWDEVKEGDPETWSNYRTELAKCFTDPEIVQIINIVHIACGLNQEKIEEATARFLATEDQTPSE